MSKPQNPTTQALAEIRNDDSVREDVKALTDRDDQYGALARVSIAIADGEQPSEADCKEAGLGSLTALFEDGDGR